MKLFKVKFNSRLFDEMKLQKILERNSNLKLDISRIKNITLQIDPAYRSGILICKNKNKVEVVRERCVPVGLDDIDSDFELLCEYEV